MSFSKTTGPAGVAGPGLALLGVPLDHLPLFVPAPFIKFILDVFCLIGMSWVGWLVVKHIYYLSNAAYNFAWSQLFPVNLRRKYGKWAVVTGATDGIGLEYVRQLADRGLNIVMVSRNPAKLAARREEVLREFARRRPDLEVETVAADLGGIDVAWTKDFQEKMKDRDVGVLINNVGQMHGFPEPMHEESPEDIHSQMMVNVVPVTLVTRAILPGMIKRGRGAVVNVSSASAIGPLPNMAVYAATKAYVDFLSRALAVEAAPHGVTIQTLMPFYLKTNMTAYSPALNSDIARPFVPVPQDFVSSAIKTIGRAGRTTGYWTHGIQWYFATFVNSELYAQIGGLMHQMLRNNFETVGKRL